MMRPGRVRQYWSWCWHCPFLLGHRSPTHCLVSFLLLSFRLPAYGVESAYLRMASGAVGRRATKQNCKHDSNTNTNTNTNTSTMGRWQERVQMQEGPSLKVILAAKARGNRHCRLTQVLQQPHCISLFVVLSGHRVSRP